MSGGVWRKCSSSPISTKTALSYAEGRFCGDAPLLCSGALLCLGALPLLYPAAPPSVFAFGKYTAPAVALMREVSAMLRAVFVEQPEDEGHHPVRRLSSRYLQGLRLRYP